MTRIDNRIIPSIDHLRVLRMQFPRAVACSQPIDPPRKIGFSYLLSVFVIDATRFA